MISLEEQMIINTWIFMILMIFIMMIYLRHIDRTIQSFLDYWCDLSLKIGMLEQQLEDLK